jgi:hypothetical protein
LAFPATGNGGGILVLPAGFCQITGAINITSGVTIIGAGAGSASGAGNSGGTVIRTNSTTADVFTVVTDQAVTFDNFGIDAPTVTKVSGSGINITLGGGGSGNKWSKITRMRISGMFDAVKLVDAQGWKIRDNQFLDFQHDGVLYAPDSSHADGSSAGGSSVISGNNFWDLNVGTSNAQFEVQGGGDIEVSNNKFVGGSLYGVLLNLQVGPTGTLLMSNNSFEEHKTANIALTQGVTTKEYANVAIIGNEFSNIANNPTSGNILIGTGTPNTAPKWIRNVNIVGNHTNDTVALTGGMIQINDGTGIAITGNVLNGNGTAGATGLSVGAAAANVSYTGNQPLGLASEFASSTMNWSAINFGAALRTSSATGASRSTRCLKAHRWRRAAVAIPSARTAGRSREATAPPAHRRCSVLPMPRLERSTVSNTPWGPQVVRRPQRNSLGSGRGSRPTISAIWDSEPQVPRPSRSAFGSRPRSPATMPSSCKTPAAPAAYFRTAP